MVHFSFHSLNADFVEKMMFVEKLKRIFPFFKLKKKNYKIFCFFFFCLRAQNMSTLMKRNHSSNPITVMSTLYCTILLFRLRQIFVNEVRYFPYFEYL